MFSIVCYMRSFQKDIHWIQCLFRLWKALLVHCSFMFFTGLFTSTCNISPVFNVYFRRKKKSGKLSCIRLEDIWIAPVSYQWKKWRYNRTMLVNLLFQTHFFIFDHLLLPTASLWIKRDESIRQMGYGPVRCQIEVICWFILLACSAPSPGGVVDLHLRSFRWWPLHLQQITNQWAL